MNSNIPILRTERLILRKFEMRDIQAFFEIMNDGDINVFLPWFTAKTLIEAEKQLIKQNNENIFFYAICLKTDDFPIGYINLSNNDSHDLGYGLRKELWNQGIVTEACFAVVELIKNMDIKFITATHDIKNPASGGVMKKIGMKYCYSYEELWQPKNFLVTFRLYQLNFDGHDKRIYREYWDKYPVHFIEKNII